MAQTTSKKRMAESFDATGSNPSPWYLDFHLPNGGCDEKIHLFFQDKEQSPFKDCGIVKDVKKDCSLDMAPCLCVKVANGDSYLLDAMTFAKDLVNGDTMSISGWVADLPEDSQVEKLIEAFIGCFKKITQHLGSLKAKKGKKRKNEDTSETTQSKIQHGNEVPSAKEIDQNVDMASLPLVPAKAQSEGELIVPPSTSLAVVADSLSIAVLNSIVQPNEKDLDKVVAKSSKSGLDGYVGIEHYFKFGVQYTQLIPVEQCNLALEA